MGHQILDHQSRAIDALLAGLRPRMDDGLVTVRRDDLIELLLAADVVAEHHATLCDATPKVAGGIDTLLVLHEAGIIDADTLEVTQTFREALVRCGRALGSAPHAAEGGSGVGAAGEFDEDVAAAEQSFAADDDEPSPDPDWPDELSADGPLFDEDGELLADDDLGITEPDLPKAHAPVD